MKKYAVIDIGSNSVRLMFVANGKVLYKRLNTTRLGEGLMQTGALNAQAIARSANAVTSFFLQAKLDGAQTVYAFATAAVRGATNGNDFVLAVKESCGLSIEVLSGETEAEVGILGALAHEDGSVIDIGGASTELVTQKDGQTVYKKSVNVGVVRLKDACGNDKTLLENRCKQEAAQFLDAVNLTNVYAIGGTATTLAALVLGLQQYSSEKITGCTLSLEAIQTLIKRLSQKSVDEIAAMPCVPKGRADVLLHGAIWLSTVMQTIGITKLIVSDRDNLEGYAVKKGLEV